MEHNKHNHDVTDKNLKAYWPLILVLFFVVGGTFHFGWVRGEYAPQSFMLDFMGLFFLAFAFFKFLNVKAFADAYRGYDILTKICPTWGYIYPFVELAFGLLLLHRIELFWTNIAIIIVLSISVIGVIQSVMQKRKIKCACLGTGFNIPMTEVSIIEDAAMIIMAIIMFLT